MKKPIFGYCKECGESFVVLRRDQEFCGSPCRQQYHARRRDKGMELYDLVMSWQKNRAGGNLTALSRAARALRNAEDERLAQRQARIEEQQKETAA